MLISKFIISLLVVVPVMGFSLEIARGGGYHGGEQRLGGEQNHGGYDPRGFDNNHPNYNAYPGADRAVENRAINDRAVNNAAAVGASLGNEYVPVPQPQTAAPTINIYTPQVGPQK